MLQQNYDRSSSNTTLKNRIDENPSIFQCETVLDNSVPLPSEAVSNKSFSISALVQPKCPGSLLSIKEHVNTADPNFTSLKKESVVSSSASDVDETIYEEESTASIVRRRAAEVEKAIRASKELLLKIRQPPIRRGPSSPPNSIKEIVVKEETAVADETAIQSKKTPNASIDNFSSFFCSDSTNECPPKTTTANEGGDTLPAAPAVAAAVDLECVDFLPEVLMHKLQEESINAIDEAIRMEAISDEEISSSKLISDEEPSSATLISDQEIPTSTIFVEEAVQPLTEDGADNKKKLLSNIADEFVVNIIQNCLMSHLVCQPNK